MVKIKMCGLSRVCDIEYANEVKPEYIGFVFVRNRRRYVEPKTAHFLRTHLSSEITPVGVFIDEKPETVAELVNAGIIDMIQLHGSEDDEYIKLLRKLTYAPVIKAFQVGTSSDIEAANRSAADYVLLDSGTGSGQTFDWSLIKGVDRPYFLAGGLTPENVRAAAEELRPYAVDASSSLETNGFKDINKMRAFAEALR